MTDNSLQKSLSYKQIFKTWWPLAASWLLMAMEIPALSAVIARLIDPKIHLAAYGGVVFPIALIIEAPIIMLLAASTALSKDWDSYVLIRRFMMWVSAGLTALHLLVALTPLYDVVVVGIIGAPAEIVEPARIGLIIMLPWTWAIAYRRFQQGVLIRFGHSGAVTIGTAIRLGADLIVLLIGLQIGTIPGIIVATTAVASGVVSEAIYVGLRIRSVIQGELKDAPKLAEPLTFNAFLAFYIPLAMTSLITMISQPIGSAGMSRMPNAINSLAVWPIVGGLLFMVRSSGMAYNEVVVTLLDRPQAADRLRKYAFGLATFLTAIFLLLAVTPLSTIWFSSVSALPPTLTSLAKSGLWFFLPLPAFNVMISWYQGLILNSKKTRAITEAIVISLSITGIVYVAGVVAGTYTGLYVSGVALSMGMFFQTIWLWYRSRNALDTTVERDTLLRKGGPKPSQSI